MVNYYETENYIFVHSFLPLKFDTADKLATFKEPTVYYENWREATDEEWADARWGNPFELATAGLNKTGKTVIFGHFHTSWPRAKYEGKPELGDGADFSPYFGEGFIAVDACTAYTNEVNVVILEDSLLLTETH
jgi:hypothetical protein